MIGEVGVVLDRVEEEDLFAVAELVVVGFVIQMDGVVGFCELTVLIEVGVMEAQGLVGKDANGLSDPYCMLGIRPGMRQLSASRTASTPQCSPGSSKRGSFRRK